MAKTPWDALSAAVTKLGDKVAQAVEAREATVASVDPVQVLFDTDTEAIPAHASLEAHLTPGDRVLTLKLRHYVWVLGKKGGVDVHQEIGSYRGTSAQRIALGLSGAAVKGVRFYDTDEGVEYFWVASQWLSTSKAIWSGSPIYMNETQEISLAATPIREMPNGIILAWSGYSGGVAQNYHYNYTHVPKAHTYIGSGGGLSILLGNGSSTVITVAKYLYISNTNIKGHASNDDGTSNTQVLRAIYPY